MSTTHSTHTPGPWRTDNQDPFMEGHGLQIYSNNVPLCVMQFGYGRRDEAIANARLIAAAPELLAALKRAVDTIVYLDENYDLRESYHAALAAIAKAESSSLRDVSRDIHEAILSNI